MKLFFEWDPRKAARNQTKHGISFDEARSADPLLMLMSAPDHSEDEERFVAIGESGERRLLIVVAREQERQQLQKGAAVNNADEGVEKMRKEYDFTNAVRTRRYADLYAQGTNVVLLQPDIAEAFPDSQSVNEALRSILKTAKKIPKGRFIGQ